MGDKAQYTLERMAERYEFNNCLDIGCGRGQHRDWLSRKGKDMYSIDILPLGRHGHIQGDFMGETGNLPPVSFDAVWASHFLEHQPNVNEFLRKIRGIVKPGGVVGICVPPAKHNIVGGHLTIWNAGLLMYNLIRAGFDCSTCHIKQQGYNIGIILPVTKIDLPVLKNDCGDIETLSRFFPVPFRKQGFDGNIMEWNW